MPPSTDGVFVAEIDASDVAQLERWNELRAIAVARSRGIELLVTANDEANAAMRGINAQLGYSLQFTHLSLERNLGVQPSGAG